MAGHAGGEKTEGGTKPNRMESHTETGDPDMPADDDEIDPRPETLRELLDRYLAEELIEFDEKTKQKHAYVLNWFERIVSNKFDDLTKTNIAKMIAALSAEGLARSTINGYRAKILALRNWAWRQGWFKKAVSVRKLPQPVRKPIAWSPAEMAQIFEGIRSLEGFVGGIPAALWWRVYHRLMLDTGERHEARMCLRWEHFTDFEMGAGVIPFGVRKGQSADMPFRVGPQTLADLRILRSYGAEPYVLPWPYTDMYFFPRYKAVLRHCGVKCDRDHMTHCGRKYFATQIKRAHGDPTEALGHANEATTEIYIDTDYIPRTWPHELLPDLRPKDQGDPPRAA